MPGRRNFSRCIEDFTCLHCDTRVEGTGYTNHCPRCLWSKHVDIVPGDRAAPCQGMMQPLRVEVHSGEYIVIHRCTKCGCEKRNKTSARDEFAAILRITGEAAGRPPAQQ